MFLRFVYPWFLLLLPLAALAAWGWLRRPRPALRFSDTALLEGLPAGRGGWVRQAGAWLRGLALGLLILGLARPTWADRVRIETEGIAIGMIVDISGSMAEKDFDWAGEKVRRIDAVKRAFRLFVTGGEGPGGVQLAGRPDDLISLVTFAARPDSDAPLTLSHSALLRIMDRAEPKSIPGDSETNISDALALALQLMQSAGPRRKVLILLSDGEDNEKRPRSRWSPQKAAQIAADLHIPVYVIDAGMPDPVALGRDGIIRTDGIKTLQEIARITGGQYFQAHQSQALLDVYQKIDQLERAPIESFQYRTYAEGFPWLGLGAFVLLIGVYGLEMTLWQRIP